MPVQRYLPTQSWNTFSGVTFCNPKQVKYRGCFFVCLFVFNIEVSDREVDADEGITVHGKQ